MRVAVVGLGRMGREVEAVLRERGHEPVPVRRGEPFPAGCPVGVDFTRADAVIGNLRSALAAGARYVVPVASHHDLARRALQSGRHVWIEKPMTETVALSTSRILFEIARAEGTPDDWKHWSFWRAHIPFLGSNR